MILQLGPGQYRITAPGDYVVNLDDTNSTESTPFLEINNVHYVTLHLRGRFEGSFGPASQVVGIKATNCAALSLLGEGVRLRGFKTAVELIGCYLARVEGLHIPDAWMTGIRHSGNSLYLANNYIQNIGGHVHSGSRCFGIDVEGAGATIVRNVVRNVFNSSEEAVGVSIRDLGVDSAIVGNIIRNPTIAPNLPNGLPGSWGVWIGGSVQPITDTDCTHNQIRGWSVGIGASSPTQAFIDENTFSHCTELMRTADHHIIGGIDG